MWEKWGETYGRNGWVGEMYETHLHEGDATADGREHQAARDHMRIRRALPQQDPCDCHRTRSRGKLERGLSMIATEGGGHVGVGSRLEEEFDRGFMTPLGCKHEGRHPAHITNVHVRAGGGAARR